MRNFVVSIVSAALLLCYSCAVGAEEESTVLMQKADMVRMVNTYNAMRGRVSEQQIEIEKLKAQIERLNIGLNCT